MSSLQKSERAVKKNPEIINNPETRAAYEKIWKLKKDLTPNERLNKTSVTEQKIFSDLQSILKSKLKPDSTVYKKSDYNTVSKKDKKVFSVDHSPNRDISDKTSIIKSKLGSQNDILNIV